MSRAIKDNHCKRETQEMVSFQDLFEKSKGRPIDYRGNTLVMFDDFPIEGARILNVLFDSCNAEWRQGISLGFQGNVKVAGETFNRGIVLWYDTAPRRVELEIIDNVPSLEVKNVWDTGNGCVESWHNGAAMIIEHIPHGRRYRCNDGLADDDFDDIVFRLERVV